MQHLRWEKTGRIFSHADEGKPYTETGKWPLGGQNVDLGNGQFAPYVWDKAKKIVKFANCELRFTASGLEFWNGKERLNTLSFNPEIKTIDFVKKVPIVSGLTVEEIDPGNSKVKLKISYKLTTEDSETEVSVRTGYNHKVHFGTKFKALKDGAEQGIELAFAEKFEPVEEKDREGKILPTARLKTDKSWWAWDRLEQIDHEIEQTTVTKVHLGRKIYILNEEKIISPDTWGPFGIAAEADDGEEINNTTWNSEPDYGDGNLYLEPGTDRTRIGLRWQDINIGGQPTITAATVKCYDGGENSITSTFTSRFQAVQSNSPSVWGSSYRPSQQTYTTAYADKVIANGGNGDFTLNIQVVIAELISDGYTYDGSGKHISLQILYVAGEQWLSICEDYGKIGGDEAELTITYTPAGGGLSIPVVMELYRQRRL